MWVKKIAASDIFSKRLGIFNQFFYTPRPIRPIHVPFYTRLQIFIQLYSNFDEDAVTRDSHSFKAAIPSFSKWRYSESPSAEICLHQNIINSCSHAMYDSAIQTILRQVVSAKLTYAASAWTGEALPKSPTPADWCFPSPVQTPRILYTSPLFDELCGTAE